MKKTVLSTLVLMGSLSFFNAGFAQAEKPTGVVIPDPVAVIDGKPLSKEAFEQVIGPLVRNDFSLIQTADQLNRLVDEYALQEKLASKARAEKLDETKDFKQSLKQIESSLLAQTWLKKIVDDIKISDEDIKAEYDKQMKAVDKQEYKAAHILVKTEKEAQDIINKLNDKKKPLDFAAAAKQYSQDPGSKENGGDLGWFRPQMMVKEFSDAVVSMKGGDVSSKPVKSSFGYHIIKLEEVRATPIASLEDSKARIKDSLVEQKVRDKIEEIQKGIKVEYKAK